MDPNQILGYAASFLIGVSLGLIGAGGSILTVPVLVYLFGVKPTLATAESLLVVGATALVGAVLAARRGEVSGRHVLLFGVPSIVTVILARRWLVPAIPADLGLISRDQALLGAFSILMILAAQAMIRPSKPKPETSTGGDSPRIVAQGLMVGLVTGIVGAGGGFLIIPALVLFGGLDMKKALGTSLAIISINTLLGFGTHLVGGGQAELGLLGSILAMALGGLVLGSYLAKRISGAKLKPMFGWFVLVMGSAILINEILRSRA